MAPNHPQKQPADKSNVTDINYILITSKRILYKTKGKEVNMILQRARQIFAPAPHGIMCWAGAM
jgi:hypothetical protein